MREEFAQFDGKINKIADSMGLNREIYKNQEIDEVAIDPDVFGNFD
ncbi:MAG: hypothetical protein ACRDAM_06235 [Casimicrobium sp.]